MKNEVQIIHYDNRKHYFVPLDSTRISPGPPSLQENTSLMTVKNVPFMSLTMI